MKIKTSLPILILLVSTYSYGQQKKTKGDLELEKIRKENHSFYENHITGLADSGTNIGVDYYNFHGKNCSEIARKENWSRWSPPNNADEKCAKFLKMKKIKKIITYPLK